MKANFAYVFHMGGMSFQDEADELELRNSSILLRRYPDYWEKAQEFKEKIDVIDYYADVLTDVIYKKKRVLIALLGDMGTDRLKEIIRQCKCCDELDGYDYTIVMNKSNRKKIKGCERETDIIYIKNLKETYHIAYSLSDPDPDEKRLLGRCSPVTVVIEDIHCIDVRADMNELTCLTKSMVFSLRSNWERCQAGESAGLKRGSGKEMLIKSIKKYLYMHHIWMFILWHRIRKSAGIKKKQ